MKIFILLLSFSLILTSCSKEEENINEEPKIEIKQNSLKQDENNQMLKEIKETEKKYTTNVDLDKLDNVKTFETMPNWAKKIWLEDLEELNLISKNSKIIEKKWDIVDWLSVLYYWDSKKILNEATKISQKLWLKILESKEKGLDFIALWNDPSWEFHINIRVDNWKQLRISVSNFKQAQEIELEKAKNRK